MANILFPIFVVLLAICDGGLKADDLPPEEVNDKTVELECTEPASPVPIQDGVNKIQNKWELDTTAVHSSECTSAFCPSPEKQDDYSAEIALQLRCSGEAIIQEEGGRDVDCDGKGNIQTPAHEESTAETKAERDGSHPIKNSVPPVDTTSRTQNLSFFLRIIYGVGVIVFIALAFIIIIGRLNISVTETQNKKQIKTKEEDLISYCPQCGWKHPAGEKVCRNPKCNLRF